MKYVFGSHHKSGTNFFLKFLRELSVEKKLSLWDRGTQRNSRKEPEHWDIYFDHWSKWVIDLDNFDFRGMHVVRHPCSLIYSATLYHQTSKERWLHLPRDNFNGKTYAEVLNSFETLEQKLIFEMENHSKTVIEDMLDIARDQRFFNIKLENISNDSTMQDLCDGFRFLGLSKVEIEDWLTIARRHCLWNMKELPSHSTTGVSEDWEKHFKGKIYERYKSIFTDSEVRLGYSLL